MPSDYINIYISKDNGKTYEFWLKILKGGAFPLSTPEILNNNNDVLIKSRIITIIK